MAQKRARRRFTREYKAQAVQRVIRIPDEGLGLDSCAVAKRVGWCAMSRGGRPWRGLLII
jgi:transposase-like protein